MYHQSPVEKFLNPNALNIDMIKQSIMRDKSQSTKNTKFVSNNLQPNKHHSRLTSIAVLSDSSSENGNSTKNISNHFTKDTEN